MRIEFDAYHVPGAQPGRGHARTAGDVRILSPQLDVAGIARICQTIKKNRDAHLSNTPVATIVDAIDAASRRLASDADQITHLISEVTGYSLPVVAETLEHMFADWRADALHEMLRAELGDERVLDQPIADVGVPAKRIAAYGHPLAFHVFSGNVPGVAVTSIVRSLLVKSATLGKLASGEPILPVLFAKSLDAVAPNIASCIAVMYWPGHNEELNAAAVKAADAVVVYGGSDAVDSMRKHISAQTHFVTHGPRVSFGVVGKQRTPDVAANVAHAVAAYDQQGCVSPHVVYVNDEVEKVRAFARDVAHELERVGRDLPRGRVSAEEAVAIRNARTAAEFGNATELYGAEKAGYSVIYEEDPGFKPSCLNRVLYVKPLPGIGQLTDLLPPQDLLQSAALEGFPESEQAELIRLLGLHGVSRVTSFAKLPWPPMHWHHDGGSPLRELLRWQDIEG